MKGYEDYIKRVKSGKIVTCRYIKLAIARYEEFQKREDIYFDKRAVDYVIAFISQMKHYLGKFANQPFILQPWQEFIVACLFGFKYKSTGNRVCRNTFIMMARKNGKTAFMAAIQLAMLLVDGEAAPEIVYVANSRDQAKILLTMTQEFAKSLDPKGKDLQLYRNYINCKANSGNIKVLSADSTKLDGMNLSSFCYDEFHSSTNRKLYDVLISSQGMRNQPMACVITTAGFNLASPCKQMYDTCIRVLEKVAEDDSCWPFIYTLDLDDDWTDEKNWIKSNPNLDITVTKDFIRGEITKAKNDSTATVGVKTKTLNIWCQSSDVWIPQETLVQQMKEVNLEDYKGSICYLAVDLSSVSDFSALSCMIPSGDKFVYKTWNFLPTDSLSGHANEELYKRFIDEGSMIPTAGNVTDYDYIIKKIQDIASIIPVAGIYYDSWNSTFFTVKCTELGYNMIPVPQGVGAFNAPTKEFERLAKEGKLIIDNSLSTLWQFGNVSLKIDHNGNCKPNKESGKNKIDSVIAMIMALAGNLKNAVNNDFSIIS